jgi:hypothetical protein
MLLELINKNELLDTTVFVATGESNMAGAARNENMKFYFIALTCRACVIWCCARLSMQVSIYLNKNMPILGAFNFVRDLPSLKSTLRCDFSC